MRKGFGAPLLLAVAAARIDAVTAADVKRVANEYFSKESMTVVVVGGRATVMPQLEPLKLGTPDERDATAIRFLQSNPGFPRKRSDRGARSAGSLHQLSASAEIPRSPRSS